MNIPVVLQSPFSSCELFRRPWRSQVQWIVKIWQAPVERQRQVPTIQRGRTDTVEVPEMQNSTHVQCTDKVVNVLVHMQRHVR